jgi:hypothetical protein
MNIALTDFNTRLKEAGFLTLEEYLLPLNKFQIHSGMTDLNFFEEYLERKCLEYTKMTLEYELGDRDKNDDLFEWVLANMNAYHDILINYRAAKK